MAASACSRAASGRRRSCVAAADAGAAARVGRRARARRMPRLPDRGLRRVRPAPRVPGGAGTPATGGRGPQCRRSLAAARARARDWSTRATCQRARALVARLRPNLPDWLAHAARHRRRPAGTRPAASRGRRRATSISIATAPLRANRDGVERAAARSARRSTSSPPMSGWRSTAVRPKSRDLHARRDRRAGVDVLGRAAHRLQARDLPRHRRPGRCVARCASTTPVRAKCRDYHRALRRRPAQARRGGSAFERRLRVADAVAER